MMLQTNRSNDGCIWILYVCMYEMLLGSEECVGCETWLAGFINLAGCTNFAGCMCMYKFGKG